MLKLEKQVKNKLNGQVPLFEGGSAIFNTRNLR